MYQGNIYLVGFMGCGKSTVAKTLMQALGMKDLDLDQAIETKMGQRIPEIFEQHGESYFRDLETECLLETKRLTQTVIATGGGIVEREVNRVFLKGQRVIYLEWPIDVLYERIIQDNNRPLARDYQTIYKRYEGRKSLYEEVASYKITCDGMTPYTVTEAISKYFK